MPGALEFLSISVVGRPSAWPPPAGLTTRRLRHLESDLTGAYHFDETLTLIVLYPILALLMTRVSMAMPNISRESLAV